MLDVAQIRICHWWSLLWQFLKQHENDEILLQFHSKMLMDQGYIKINARFLENFEEKWRERVCDICNFWSRSKMNEVLIQILLGLVYIYDALIIFLIPISQMWMINEDASVCAKLSKPPHVHGNAATVHVFMLNSLAKWFWRQMQVEPSECNAYFSNSSFSLQIQI